MKKDVRYYAVIEDNYGQRTRILIPTDSDADAIDRAKTAQLKALGLGKLLGVIRADNTVIYQP